MNQFAKTSLNILSLHAVVAMYSLKVGTRPSRFIDFLYVDPPINIGDLRAQASKYINIEDNFESRKKDKEQYKTSYSFPQDFKKRRVRRFDTYTPLTPVRTSCSKKFLQ